MAFPFDEMLLQQIQLLTHPLLDIPMLAVTFLGNPALWVMVAALIYWKGKENESFYLMNLIVFTAASAAIAKLAFRTPRPSPDNFRVLTDNSHLVSTESAVTRYAFPSGHSVTIAGAFGHFYNRIIGNWKIIALILVLFVGFSRLYLGRHFPMDVIVGLLMGFVIGKANYWLVKDFREHHFKPTKIAKEIGIIIALAVATIIVIFFRPPVLAVIILGFYAGFFFFKEKEFKQTPVDGKALCIKLILGGAGAGAIATPAILIENLPLAIELALFFIAGAWVSAIYPALYERVLKKRIA